MQETIGIIGVGKMGLCFALNLERSGYHVLGVDVDAGYISRINGKTLTSAEPQVSDLLKLSRNLHVSSSFEEMLHAATVIFIAVATPTSEKEGYDHSQLDDVIEKLIRFGRQEKRKHLVVSCTTMPGHCDKLAARIEPFNFSLSYNPEFIAQGSIIHNQQHPDQVLIGEADKEAGDAIEAVFRKLTKSNPAYCRMSRLSAEICKLATNCFLTTKISFANAIGDLAMKAGAEPDKILAAIGSDSRIGDKYLKYGFGFGGPCFPRDNRALAHFADTLGFDLLISRATDQTNAQHLEFMFRKNMNGQTNKQEFVFDYVTYKPGINLIEESQPLALAVKLARVGKQVTIRETKDVIEEVKKIYGDLFIYVERN